MRTSTCESNSFILFYCWKCLETGEYHNKCLRLGSAWYSYSIFYMLDRKISLCLLASANSFEAECSGGRCVGRCWWRGKGLARGGRSNKSSCGTIPTATCPAHKIPFGSLRWQWNCSQCSIRNVYVYIYIHMSHVFVSVSSYISDCFHLVIWRVARGHTLVLQRHHSSW